MQSLHLYPMWFKIAWFKGCILVHRRGFSFSWLCLGAYLLITQLLCHSRRCCHSIWRVLVSHLKFHHDIIIIRLCPKISRQKIFSTFNINFTSSVSSFLTFPSNNPATLSWFFGQIFSHSSSALVHSGGQMPVFKCPMHALFLSYIQALIYFSDFGPLLVIANALFVRSWQLRSAYSNNRISYCRQ